MRTTSAVLGAAAIALCNQIASPATTFTYDPLDRLTGVDYGNGQVVSYTYDAAGNRLARAVTAAHTVSIATSAAPAGSGVTAGGGVKFAGSAVTVTATANSGYHFVNWTEGTTPVSASASYGFVAVVARSLVANFASGAPGAIAFAPASLAFGIVPVGSTSAAQSLSVTNTGGSPVTLAGISAQGDFGQGNTCGSVLAPAASCALQVVFTPSTPGVRYGLVVVNSDAPGSPHKASLSGSGKAVSQLTLSTGALDFGSHPLLTPAVAQTVTLTNTGSAALALGAIAPTATDYSVKKTCGTSLVPAASCDVTVQFTPRGIGEQPAVLSIASDAPDSPHAMTLAGYGAVASDLDGNARSDIVWRHITLGTDQLWRMNGLQVLQTLALPSQTDVGWKIVAIADFNGDGRNDLLWRHATTGANRIWLMDGVRLLSNTVLPTVADASWQVAGTGDFDGDGKADILWHHATLGSNQLWLMDGVRRVATPAVAKAADTGWQIVGIGDFDGDGKADIAWRHATSGANAVWLMDGATLKSIGNLPTVADANWKIVQVGDFDGDGKADLLLRNQSTGVNTLWLMNGAVRKSAADVTAADSTWTAVGCGDFNGDGKADILWRRNTGENSLWLMNGAAVTSSGALPSLTDLNWTVAPTR